MLQVVDAENRWRAVGLLHCAVLGTALLIGFAVEHLLVDDRVPAFLALAGLPFMAVTAIRAQQKPVMPFWAPYPAVGFLLALLLLTLVRPSVFGGAALMWFAAVPPLTMLALRWRIGLAVSVLMFAPVLLTFFFGSHELPTRYAIRFCLAYALTTAIMYTYERNRERVMRDLLEAGTRIDTLEGMLNMCGWCHQRMRDESGQWVSTERYFQDRAPVTFSHGMCPDCASKAEAQLAGRT